MSFHFSAQQAEPWASVPLAVQPSQGRSASGDPRRQSGAARGPPGAPGCGSPAPRIKEAGILPISRLGKWRRRLEQRLVPGLSDGQGPAPGLHGAPARGAAPPARSPEFKRRPAPSRPRSRRLPGRGGASGAAGTSPRQRGLPGRASRGLGLRGRLVGSAAAWTACSWRRWPPPWSASSSAERYVRRPPQPGASF